MACFTDFSLDFQEAPFNALWLFQEEFYGFIVNLYFPVKKLWRKSLVLSVN